MRLANHTDIPDDFIRAVIRAVCPANVTGFDVRGRGFLCPANAAQIPARGAASQGGRMTNKKIRAAHERCRPAVAALTKSGATCLEQNADTKNGVVWERWALPNGTPVILWAAEYGWNLFSPLTLTANAEAALAALANKVPGA